MKKFVRYAAYDSDDEARIEKNVAASIDSCLDGNEDNEKIDVEQLEKEEALGIRHDLDHRGVETYAQSVAALSAKHRSNDSETSQEEV